MLGDMSEQFTTWVPHAAMCCLASQLERKLRTGCISKS